jgi:hypothetical protein
MSPLQMPQGIVYVLITIKFPMNDFFNKQQIIDISFGGLKV